jgi:hypothetical protein
LTILTGSARQVHSTRHYYGPFPNTDPGLAGETGTSGVVGAVFGVDGLSTGGGMDGA